ncbi:M13-type metalloendopeptidase [Silvimonas sp.]|uniref:M13 family metallopeptidase n=1 Tax=Silvimonas sp. TaxID=2650811 RepID=UPI0028491737|nr:M13-type metalloendopeptidase [Silvimonas sp.]MDR3429345.1 M13-type metalloendopeptidase [Silvimonas sp.]
MKHFKLATLTGALLLSLHVAAAPVSGIDFANFDKTVRVQDDLYLHTNGTWIKNTTIPADKGSTGAFLMLRDLSEARSRKIIEDAAAKPVAGTESQQIGDLYRSYMDEATVEKLGVTPVKPALAAIDKLASADDVVRYFGQLQPLSVSTPLMLGVEVNPKDSRQYLPAAYQGGLGLPDRDYFLLDDPRFVAARGAYLTYLTKLFTLAGETQPAEQAKAVIALETALAKVQWSKVENRDPVKTYNKLTVAELQKLSPGFNWQAFLEGGKMGSVADVDLGQPTYATALGKLLQDQPLATWRSYLKARVLADAAPLLSKAFVDNNFEFHGKALTGTTEDQPRWKRAVALEQAGLGEAVGKLYVAQYFPPAYKARMEALVGNLLKAYGQSIDKLTWMGPETKKQAQIKLAKYAVKIGYPNTWRDYSTLQIKPDDLFGNATRISEFSYNRDLARLGKPVDRSEWLMTPQTVNAYYNPPMNEIVFPAAILQPPFFDMAADDAANYGAIGAVIGHEISHGFDDQGSQFDADGNLKEWWTADDRAKFTALTDRLVAQYDAYEPLPGQHVNGKLTLGENIADNSGLQIAYKAYHLSLNGKEAPVIDGLTGDQRFYLAFAQVWRSKTRDESLLRQVKSDPHSPASFRAIGAVENSDAFFKAFDVKQGDKMYKPEDQRIRIW